MSILRLEAVDNGSIDSRYIDAVETTIQNLGKEGFDVLVQAYHPEGPYFVAVHHVPAYSAVVVPDIETQERPFTLLFVTNINTYSETSLTIYAKRYGSLVAIYTQEDFIRMH